MLIFHVRVMSIMIQLPNRASVSVVPALLPLVIAVLRGIRSLICSGSFSLRTRYPVQIFLSLALRSGIGWVSCLGLLLLRFIVGLVMRLVFLPDVL